MEETSNDYGQRLQEQTIQALEAKINEKEKVIQQQESENERLTRQLVNAETELAQLKGGLTFRLVGGYHHIVDRLLPLESRRRHAYNLGMRFAHILLLEGPRSLYHEMSHPLAGRRDTTEDVIIYQMGKVGSSSVVASLKYAYSRLALPVQVYHVHTLNYLDEPETNASIRAISGERLQVIQSYRALRKLIDQDHQKRWKLISLVRDPVARNVASFFHGLDELMPDWRERRKKDLLSLEKLQDLFLDIRQGDHKTPEVWFDNEMLPVFGIDVFAEPFPKDIGYKIYEGPPRASLLLIRLENLTACAPKVMRQFLGLDDFALMNSNMGDDKEYADDYRAFRRLPLPKTYVEAMYSTRFARHFYTGPEIEKFTRIWTAVKKG